MKRVCSSCFDDKDLRAWIRDESDGVRGCYFCGGRDSPTLELKSVTDRIIDRIERYYSKAVNELPFNSAEGGYLGPNWDSYDLLNDEIGLELPRDNSGRSLFHAIFQTIEDEVWCEFDPAVLDPGSALWLSWENFCETVKHKRRFFFHATGKDSEDSYTPASLLAFIAEKSESIGLIKEIPSGTELWRARPGIKKGKSVGAADFGPPPAEYALQSNRMNPAGISLLYLASTINTALKETRESEAKVGLWCSTRPLRVLDLRKIPPIPGFFSDATRMDKETIDFLDSFSSDIMKPVARDERNHIDYLPSQVVTEFMRDFNFDGGALDGIAYGSTINSKGWNVALFIDSFDLGIDKPEWGKPKIPSLKFKNARWSKIN